MTWASVSSTKRKPIMVATRKSKISRLLRGNGSRWSCMAFGAEGSSYTKWSREPDVTMEWAFKLLGLVKANMNLLPRVSTCV